MMLMLAKNKDDERTETKSEATSAFASYILLVSNSEASQTADSKDLSRYFQLAHIRGKSIPALSRREQPAMSNVGKSIGTPVESHNGERQPIRRILSYNKCRQYTLHVFEHIYLT